METYADEESRYRISFHIFPKSKNPVVLNIIHCIFRDTDRVINHMARIMLRCYVAFVVCC
jgi:hypothetical protein